MNKTQKWMLYVVVLIGIVLTVVLGSRYFSARKELSDLKKELETSTAAWKQTNEEKLVVQKELKEVKNQLREAELTIDESTERAQELKKEIEELEAQILAFQSK